MTNDITPIHEYKKYWAECFGTAPFLPTSRKEMDALYQLRTSEHRSMYSYVPSEHHRCHYRS